MILSICSDPRVLSIIRLVKIVITIIKIVVPLILIISGMIGFVRATMQGEVNDTLKSLIRKVIAAILIFLIPTFVSILANLVGSNNEYVSCFKSATKDGVNEAYVAQAKQYVLDAKNTLNTGLYTVARTAVSKLDDEGVKSSLEKELVSINDEIIKAQEERKKKEEERKKAGDNGGNGSSGGSSGSGLSPTSGGSINPDGKYTKAEIIDMGEQQVKNMSNQEFIEFIASAARLIYAEYGGVLPSITIAQACLESGYGNSFINTTHNVYGLIGYPGNKPKVGVLRQFDNFYEATYYHYAYFQNYTNVYGNFLAKCANHDALGAASYLGAYAGGSQTYAPSIQSIINTYNLTQYDY